jgi:hypothetical protein
MPFYVMPFEKRFMKKWTSPQLSSNPSSPQEMEHRKKEKKEKEKKLHESPQIKGEVNIWRGECNTRFLHHKIFMKIGVH